MNRIAAMLFAGAIMRAFTCVTGRAIDRHAGPGLGRIGIHALLTGCLACTALNAQALDLLAVQSRKVNPAVGNLDVPVDITRAISGAVTTESRVASGGNVLVFQFDTAITQAGSASVTDENGTVLAGATVAAGAATAANEVSITLPPVGDGRRLAVTLANVNGSASKFVAAIGFLLADGNSDGKIDAADLQQVKAFSGQASAPANLRSDFNASGHITAADVVVTKSRNGNKLLPAYTVGGTISGLSGPATLQLNGLDTLVLSIDGHFTFPNALVNGGNYLVAVTQSPVSESCLVTNGSGMIAAASVVNIAIQCSVTDAQPPSVLFIDPPNAFTLNKFQSVTIHFSESMDPASLVMSGSIAMQSTPPLWTTTASSNDTLILQPAGTWQSGLGTLAISATDTARNPLQGAPVNFSFGIDTVFVSPGGFDGADGTPVNPLRTAQSGVTKAQANGFSNVWLAQGTYTEVVTMLNGINITGGFEPVSWQSNPNLFQTTLIGLKDFFSQQYVTVKVDNLPFPVSLRNLIVIAPTPLPPPVQCNGGACGSYAVHAANSNLSLHNVRIVGAAVASGLSGTNAIQTAPTAPAPTGSPGGNAGTLPASTTCDSTTRVGGGGGATNSLPLAQSGNGGAGGAGGTANTSCSIFTLDLNPSPGATGVNAARTQGLAGRGGAGGATCAVVVAGNAGVPATDGAGGVATSGSTGTLDGSGYYINPANGTSGQIGTDGGGGGGGGSGGCGAGTDSWGAGGGGGGAGGIRSQLAGGGGSAGGSSFGVLAWNSTLTLDNVTVFIGNGGSGGSGGAGSTGQPGGSGGAGGQAAGSSLAGGRGGVGARGGHSGGGAGGAGGNAYGIYTQGTQVLLNNVTYSGGGFGLGGLGGVAAINSGQQGQNGQLIPFQ